MKKLSIVFMLFALAGCKSYTIEKEYADAWNYTFCHQDSLAISSYRQMDSLKADIHFWDYYSLKQDSLIVQKNDTLKIFKKNEFVLRYELFKESADTVYCLYNYDGTIKKYYRYFGDELMKIRENVSGEMIPIFTNLDIRF